MSWQNALRNSINTPEALAAGMSQRSDFSEQAQRQFPLRVPGAFRDLIDFDNHGDPLLRQVYPHRQEELPAPGFSDDPLDERSRETTSGILHKYHGRVLLIVTGACAIHCRYCFRRHYPYADSNPLQGQWQDSLAWLREHREINEVILSGGDPLTLPDDKLAALIDDLQTIDHLTRLRIHTRIPVVLPERVGPALIGLLDKSRFAPVVVLHVNHPAEISHAAVKVLSDLRQAGITLLNQSVLLAGVNDNADTLIRLSEDLFGRGVLPYYLHMLDPVAGAAHFEVNEADALALHRVMQQTLPGYLVPRLVREIGGLQHKQVIA